MFWKLTFLIFLLVLMVNKNDHEDASWLFCVIIHFIFCTEVSNLLIDVLACYGIKPV